MRYALEKCLEETNIATHQCIDFVYEASKLEPIMLKCQNACHGCDRKGQGAMENMIVHKRLC